MNQMERVRKGANWIEGIVLAAIVVFLILGMMAATEKKTGEELQSSSEMSSAGSEPVLLEEGWYRLEDGEETQISVSSVLELEGDSLTLYYENLPETKAGMAVLVRGGVYEPTIAWEAEDGSKEILYQYSEEAFQRNDQMKSKLDCMAVLPAELSGGRLVLTLKNTQDGEYEIPEIYLGSQSAILRLHYRNSMAALVIVTLMLFLGLAAFLISVYLKQIHIREPRFLDVSLFLLICAAWCLLDSSIVQTDIGMAGAAGYLSFYAFMLLAVPMLHFMQHTLKEDGQRILNGYLLAFYANALIQGALNCFAHISLVRMLFVTQLLLFTGVLTLGGLLLREYRRPHGREIAWFLRAFLLVGGSGLLALLLYWVFEISYYDLIFEAGVLIFVFVLMCGLMFNITESYRFRTETLIYQRLSREDQMTGMQNRRAFEEKLEELQNQVETYENMALLFFHVENLKKYNDRFGKGAGDELVLAAARCIESVFQEKGFCYRLSGDEFCVILPNPREGSAVWFERLDFEVESKNNSSHTPYRLSLGKGCSFLRGTDGSVKSFSDWKFEANQDMNRGRGGRTEE